MGTGSVSPCLGRITPKVSLAQRPGGQINSSTKSPMFWFDPQISGTNDKKGKFLVSSLPRDGPTTNFSIKRAKRNALLVSRYTVNRKKKNRPNK